VRLRKIFRGIKDGYSSADAEFPRLDGETTSAPSGAAASAAASAAAKAAGRKPAPAPQSGDADESVPASK
jgi:hypothetical protein